VAAADFSALLLALLVAHQVADHWVQTDEQARLKRLRGRVGVLACLRHVASYTACTALAGVAAWQVFDLRVSMAGFLAGQLASAVTHYWADRCFTLEWVAGKLGKSGYYANGGAYQLDQSFHWFWLTVAAGLAVAI
jgi:putative flippase GtrA